MDFNKLKKKKGQGLKTMAEKLEKLSSGGGSQRDERIWKPAFDKTEGKGRSIVRFLPSQYSEDDIHFQKVHHHFFRGKNGFYIENSRLTIGESDPANDSFWMHYNKSKETGNDSYWKKVKGARGDKQKYYANVYVIKDSANPENEGQVKIFEFGPGLFKKIEQAIKPEFEDDTPFDPFDMWEGADFVINAVGNEIPDNKNPGKMVMVPKYDTSMFKTPSEFMEDDDEHKKELFEQTYDLSEFAKVKSFDELAERFEKVTGEKWNYLEEGDEVSEEIARLEKEAKNKEESGQSDDEDDDLPWNNDDESNDDNKKDDSGEDDEDDALAMFKRMAKDS